jgi:hypothetical protein
MTRLLLSGLALATCLAMALAAAEPQSSKIDLSVLDKQSGKPVPCRIHLKDSAGKAQQVPGLPFFRDHFVCNGTVALELKPGEYTYEIERGPEYSRASGKFTVKDKGTAAVKAELERLVNMPAEGWWPGELHVHRLVEDIELLMKAEDLHIAPVITWWNNRNQWATQKRLPEKLLIQFDNNRYYHVMAGEDEREGGALLYFNLPQPLPITGASREYPSPIKFLSEARKQKNVWIDIEKPFWWDTPVWLATGQVDSIGLANNHMCRSEVRDAEAWGKPRDKVRLPPPHGNGLWTQEIYYQVLNSGLRLPPSAGSASGVLPNPVGHNRLYVHNGKELDYDGWWQHLRAGQCFVTNGPLLRVEADGKLPGHVFTGGEGREISIEIKAKLTSREPVPFLEIVQNGQVIRKVPFAEWSKTGSLGTVTLKSSGWFLVRALADDPKTFRFASTGPYYVEIGSAKSRISKASAQFFLDWVRERAARIKLTDAEQQKEVLEHHRLAEKFWQDKVATANAE